MHVLSEGLATFPQDPAHFLDFNFARNKLKDILLIPGLFEMNDLRAYASKYRIVHLELEEPNRFCVVPQHWLDSTYESKIEKVFTLCPYTAKWLNTIQGFEKRVPVFFPFSRRYIPKIQKKRYEVIYTGHLAADSVLEYIKTLKEFNYAWVSNSDHELVTHKEAPYIEKLNLMAQSKVTLVHNLLYPKVKHFSNIRSIPHYQDNLAFQDIPRQDWWWKLTGHNPIYMPQLKSRVFEAAFCRSLILCRKDSFKVIECYFEPDKDFVYYEHGHLKETLQSILEQFDQYLPMINRAFDKAVEQYTTHAFYDKYLKDL